VRYTPPGLALDKNPNVADIIVLAPVTNQGWGESSHKMTLDLLDEVLASTCADSSRVILTGISMGGNGAFSLGAAHAHRFAGVSPICGWSDTLEDAMDLAHTPMFIAHGTEDVVVPEGASSEMVQALEAAGNKMVIYSKSKGQAPNGYSFMAGHDSWTETYTSNAWWNWVAELRPQTQQNK
jgi:predicted peptidase